MELKRPMLEQLGYLARNIVTGEKCEHEALQYGDYDSSALAIACYNSRGPSHVFEANGLPYYAAGFHLPWPGIGMCWSISTPEAQKHILEMTRICRRAIRAVLGTNVHRIQMMCMADHMESKRWFEVLGAHEESVLKSYGRNGEDFAVYAILRAA